MSYCLIVEHPGIGREEWLGVVAQMRERDAFPPPGQSLVVAGQADSGWRVVSVWDSLEAREAFEAEHLRPVCRERGIDFGQTTTTAFAVDVLVAGDLTQTLAR
jgi:hypothetical protein